MKRPKKYTLLLDDTIDFDVIGICSHQSDFRTAWEINNGGFFKFEKSEEDYVVYSKKNEVVSSHSMYEFYEEESKINYYLIKNKSLGEYLFPEKRSIDFLLFICNNHSIDPMDLVVELKKIQKLVGVYFLDVDEIPSANSILL